MAVVSKPADIIDFWFQELGNTERVAKNADLDNTIRQRFAATLLAAARGELAEWRSTLMGRLAEIIVLDQFSRNIYRDDPRAFAQDPQALTLAQELLTQLHHKTVSANSLTLEQLSFAYLPFMHSESLQLHKVAVQLFSLPGLESNLSFELKHQAIIARFGRYPHRNAILGRVSTPEEIEFLEQPGSGF